MLRRQIGLLPATFLVIGNIIGIGIFTTSGLVADRLGPTPWVIGVWGVGGLLALTGSICYAVLAAERPVAGGEYALLLPAYGPLVAFLAGWASLLIGFSAPVAAGALGLASYAGLPGKGMAAATVLGVTLLMSLGLRPGNWIHSALSCLNLALVGGFAALLLWKAGTPHLGELGARAWTGVPLPGLATSIVMVMFAYSGWNAAVYVAEEIRRPGRNIPGALLAGTVSVTVLYLLVNLAYFSAAPFADLQGQIAVAARAVEVAAPGARWLVTLLILVSILTSMTAMSIAGPRVYFAMSRDRLFPARLTRVDPRRQIPLISLWFQSAVALLLILAGTLAQILVYAGFVLLLFTALTVSTLFLKRAPGQRRVRFLLLYRLLPAFFVGVNAAVLLQASFANPGETLAGALTLAAGLPVYLYYRGR